VSDGDPVSASASIRITYRESAEFVMEGLSQIPPNKRFNRSLWIWATIIAAIIALQIFKNVLADRTTHTPTDWPRLIGSYGLAAVLLGSLLFALYRWSRQPGPLSRRYYREIYRKQTGREETQVIAEFGGEALFISTEGGIASHYPWAAVVRAVERPKGLLVYTGPELFHWFPKTAFASENDYAVVVRMVQSKVTNFSRLD